MSSFSLDAGGGAQAAGQGIGNLFRALAMAPQVRQKAEADAALQSARIYQANMTGNKSGAEATGLGMTNAARDAPIPEGVPDYLKNAIRLFQMTGDTNAERVAKAGTEVQTQGIRDSAVGSVDDLERMNRLNTLAKPGATYTPFDAVGNTGTALNKATGEQVVANEALRRLFGNEAQSRIVENNAQANNANASAGKHTADRDYTRQKSDHFTKTGALPGSGAEGSGGALSTNVLAPIKAPVLDSKGRPVTNPLTGEIETKVDPVQMERFLTWSTGQNATPTAKSFSRWVAEGKPGAANKSAEPSGGAPTISPAPTDRTQRKSGTVYDTPKGPMKWTGTGWVPAK